jgi:hypothetical protein
MTEDVKGNDPNLAGNDLSGKESPTLPEGGGEAKKSSPEDEAKELLGALEKLGVKNPEQITNMATASQQVGEAWNRLGATRDQLGAANDKIKDLEAKIAALSQQSRSGYDPDYDNESLDVAALIETKTGQAAEKAVRTVVAELTAVNQARAREMAQIQQDEYYPAVADIWTQYLGNPQTQANLQSGHTTLSTEYNKVVRKFMGSMLSQSQKVIEGITGAAAPGKQEPLHLESGASSSEGALSSGDDDAKKENIKKIVEQRATGGMSSDDALEALIRTVLPPDDSIWK